MMMPFREKINIFPAAALAKVISDVSEAPVTKLSGATTAVLAVLKWMVGIFWVITVAFVIWAAFLYLTAGGDEEKVKAAKKQLTHAVIAAVIALLATGIDLIVYYLLKGVVY